jgi:hypothetical protein
MSRPIFIGGAGRSGTTLVVDLLGTHPRLSPIYETDFVGQLLRTVLHPFGPAGATADRIRRLMDEWTEPLPHRPHTKREHERYRHGPHHVLLTRELVLERTERLVADLERSGPGPSAAPLLRAYLTDLFDRHAALDDKPRWINKTPGYVMMLDLLHEVFPDLLFVHCLRDGRAATASAITRPWGPKTWEQGAAWWRRNVEAGQQYARRHPENVVLVRYEDLLAEPERELAGLLGALGETGAVEVLQRYLQGGYRFDPARAGRWRDQVARADLALFERHNADLMRELGYAMELAGPSA